MSTAQTQMDRPPTRTRRHRALTVIGALIALTMIAVGALNLLDLAASQSFTTRARYTGVHSLVIDTGNGAVHLVGAPPGSQLVVTEHVDEGLSTPQREARRSAGGVLRLETSCSLLPHCGVSYDIAVPGGVGVDARSGAGNITADRLATRRPVRLHSGAGDVSAKQVGAPIVDISSGAGDISAQLTSPPRLLSASAGAGDVRLVVPNVVYAVHASSGAGTVSDHSLRIDPAASRTITASSGAGDVTITAGEAG